MVKKWQSDYRQKPVSFYINFMFIKVNGQSIVMKDKTSLHHSLQQVTHCLQAVVGK